MINDKRRVTSPINILKAQDACRAKWSKFQETFPERFWGRIIVQGADDCWIWTGAIGKHGYGNLAHKQKMFTAHRMAYILARGEITGGLFVCHRCDVKLCCNPAHLVLGTHKQNMEDASKKGRMASGERSHFYGKRGEACPHHKLSNEQVLDIRERSKKGMSTRGVARIYKISASVAKRIIDRKIWKHI